MEKSISRILTEIVVKRALERIKEDPERGIRNLVDMAAQFSKEKSQRDFFATAQTMLQNENSAYYALVRDTVSRTDAGRLFTFGMNLGYNGCTAGARRIRENEKKLGCGIPWTVLLQVDEKQVTENRSRYDELIREGEGLGIFTWMLFATERPQVTLSLAGAHADSAFCIFCEAEDITDEFLAEAAELYNIMLVVRWDEKAADTYASLRNMGLLYSVWYLYGTEDAERILNGDLFCGAQQVSPAFTVLLAKHGCPEETRRLVCQAVQSARKAQCWQTLLWEMQGDIGTVGSVISNDARSVCFDQDGHLYDWDKKVQSEHNDLFHSSFSEILTSSYAKVVGKAG